MLPLMKALLRFRRRPCARAVLAVVLIATSGLSHLSAATHPAARLLGRWDLTVRDNATSYPSWLEVRLSGNRTLVGTYVARFGSARPVSQIDFDPATGAFKFVVPPQWEKHNQSITVEGRLEGDGLAGQTINDQGAQVSWTGRHAPALDRERQPKWGKPIKLFNGRDLSGWKPRDPVRPNGWRVSGGHLTNAAPGNDLVSEQSFDDFKLRAVFRYPKASNSGIYLRGRYEVQIEDNFGLPPDSHYIGGVYGHLTPRVNTARPAGEWQTMDITLVGRVVTILLNGEPIIERQVIPGITGGALDSAEDRPGPLLIQGDHGPVEFKELTLTPTLGEN